MGFFSKLFGDDDKSEEPGKAAMVQRRKFMDLVLDEEGVHTPDGVLTLNKITRADIIRNRSLEYGGGGYHASGAGILSGSVIGGAIAGPLGAIGGGLLGSTVEQESGNNGIMRTTSATLIFESPELAYSTKVSRDRVEEAQAFVDAVKNAAERRRPRKLN
ncbi:hypothetical protein [Desulfonatronum sp. SC1]|uniref:hypothetical protein n=1 Tax=Desulfonatronum sp. SC1 TaxID=2109626 RepID=UPI000D30D9E0|nr:hypothetical protein [Desulfonatronum sp. SC1]PTN38957.1 hypothetical protein C6366_00525 [Desulfonatronum sp. SC1]